MRANSRAPAVGRVFFALATDQPPPPCRARGAMQSSSMRAAPSLLSLIAVLWCGPLAAKEIACQESHTSSCSPADCKAQPSETRPIFTIDTLRKKIRRCIDLFGSPECFDLDVIEEVYDTNRQIFKIRNSNMASDLVIIASTGKQITYFQTAIGQTGTRSTRGTCSEVK